MSASVYGIFGWPVAHSRSPAMHNAAFEALGLDAVYVPFAIQPERLGRAVDAVRALGIAGLNVTLPHKSAVIALLDEITPAARAIAAVNTVSRRGELLVGDNTDAEGLTRSLLEAGVMLQGTRVVVLGAGGAARAAVFGLASAGAAHITIAARKRDAAAELAAELAPHSAGAQLAVSGLDAELTAALADCTLLIQATSATLGASGAAQTFVDALALDALPASATVCDLVYKPLRTALLARAEQRRLRSVDGLGMLLHQGALAFERFTGRAPPIAVMRRALEQDGVK
jgi:shikimate dehydrogenase